MLRITLASSLLSLAVGLRMDHSQHQEPALSKKITEPAVSKKITEPAVRKKITEPMLRKKFTGPEHRNCRIREKVKSCDGSACRQREEVIGGTVVEDPGEFPFLAWLGDNDGTLMGQFCGGSLITDRVVLTAGHCLYSTDDRNAHLWVRLGLANFADKPGIARNVINWRRHPEYSSSTLHNDLTLLLLNESVPAELVTPLKLSDGTAEFERCGDKTVVGWGSTDEQCSVYDTLLRKANVPMGTDGPDCSTKGSKTLTPEKDYDVHSQVCAGDYFNDMRYPGCGDSGGPLLARDNSTWYQVGMVSWSFGIPYPDVFTRVSYFHGWINETVAELMEAGVNPAVTPNEFAQQNRTQG